MDVIDTHPSNALVPIDVTEDGMFIDERFSQSRKASISIDVIFDVIFTVFKLIHPLNVYLSIEATPDGIVMDVNDKHPKKCTGSN